MRTDERVLTPAVPVPDGRPVAATVPLWPAAVVTAVAAGLWLTLRPAAPSGVAAVIDLVVLPAVLAAEVRLLAGRTTLPLAGFALFFGLGAVGATVAAVVVERAAGAVAGASAASAVGPLVEEVAICAPVLVFALVLAGGRRCTVADHALAGLASGLGFLVVHTSLVTAARHGAPDYLSPLVAGFQRVPGVDGAGVADVYFVGPAVAATLVGLAAGLGVRFRDRAWRLLPSGAAVALVVFDHSVFDRRLRRFLASELSVPSGFVDGVQAVTLHGRLALVLVVAGLVAAGRTGTAAARPRAAPPPVIVLAGYEAGQAGPVPAGEAVEPIAGDVAAGVGVALAVPVDAEVDAEVDGPTVVGAAPGASAPMGVVRRWAVVAAIGSAAAVVLTALARDGKLDALQRRPLALGVSLLGLAYSAWCLGSARRRPGSPAWPDLRTGRLILCAAAVLSSALGIACALLPDPGAPPPAHGGLLLAAVLGWGAHVGNLGVVLGLGGLAAPPATERPSDGWARFLWTVSRGRRGRPGGAGAAAAEGGWSGRPGRRLPWWGRASRRRRAAGPDSRSGAPWRRLRLGRRPAPVYEAGAGTAAEHDLPVTVAIERVRHSPQAPVEFVGATVREAIEAAMAALGAGLAHTSLQLVDEGSANKPGKGSTGRPARVRVAEAPDDDVQTLLAPGRRSMTRHTAFDVVVRIVVEAGAEPPESVDVTLRTSRRSAGSRVLACRLDEWASGVARYRSNPYTFDHGEDATWARTPSEAPPGRAGGIRMDDGDELRAEHGGGTATVTVFDGWAQEVLAVNRDLLDLTGDCHRRVLAEMEERRAELEEAGDDDDRVRHRIGQLRARLSYVAEGKRVLSGRAGTGPSDDAVARAFTSTALLHLAMSLDGAHDDPGGARHRAMTEAAARALDEHRRRVAADPDDDVATGSYRELLMGTVVGQLWTDGVLSASEIGRRLGWERFSA